MSKQLFENFNNIDNEYYSSSNTSLESSLVPSSEIKTTSGGSVNKLFTLMSFNILRGRGYNPKSNLKIYGEYNSKISELIDNHNVDILCTQENEDLTMTSYKTYEKACGDTTHEAVQIYIKKDHEQLVTHNSWYCINSGKRYAKFITINNVKIATLHLEGGSYTDKHVLNNYDKFIETKMNLLKDVVEENPDIICGDFNSVYSKDDSYDELLKNQYNYFETWIKKNTLSDEEKEKIINVNKEPFEYLIDYGYKYATPDNERNLNFTSFMGETIVDFVWYKENKIDLVNCNIIDIRQSEYITLDNNNNKIYISDHNPVLFKFNIKSSFLKESYIKPTEKRLMIYLKKNKCDDLPIPEIVVNDLNKKNNELESVLISLKDLFETFEEKCANIDGTFRNFNKNPIVNFSENNTGTYPDEYKTIDEPGFLYINYNGEFVKDDFDFLKSIITKNIERLIDVNFLTELKNKLEQKLAEESNGGATHTVGGKRKLSKSKLLKVEDKKIKKRTSKRISVKKRSSKKNDKY